MAVFRHSADLPAEAKGSVLAIGNFDGVHRGHQVLIGEAREIASREGAPIMVLTFEPHPRSVFNPDAPPFRLTTLRTRIQALEELGVDHLVAQHFDLEFAKKSAEEFVREILVRDLAVRHVVVGWDFCFGSKRAGNVELLRRMGAELGFVVTALSPVRASDEEIYSSSTIRQALQDGLPDKAARLLGRPWEIEGRVESGDRRGRTIGFPTANVALGDLLRPALGVYAVHAGIDRGAETEWHRGVANLGRRPTVDGTRVQLEVHLFDFDGDLYGQHLRTQMVSFLRPEKKFDGLPALQAQIAADCGRARELLEA